MNDATKSYENILAIATIVCITFDKVSCKYILAIKMWRLFNPYGFNIHKFADTVIRQFTPVSGIFHATER